MTSGGLSFGPRSETEDGVEQSFARNYLGRFLVINKLLPLMLQYVFLLLLFFSLSNSSVDPKTVQGQCQSCLLDMEALLMLTTSK